MGEYQWRVRNPGRWPVPAGPQHGLTEAEARQIAAEEPGAVFEVRDMPTGGGMPGPWRPADTEEAGRG